MADINVTEEIIDINVTEEVVNIIAPSGGYPLPNTINSVFGRVGNIVATEGDYTLTQLAGVTITSPANGQVLKYNGTQWINDSDAGITGTGTTNTLPKFTGASTIGNSNVSDSGTLITLGSDTTISSGSLGIGTSSLTGYSFNVSKNITGATTSYGIRSQGVVQSDVTTLVSNYGSLLNTAAASFTLVDYVHHRSMQGTIGAGSIVTNQYGYFADSSMTGATNNYGFYGGIASGTNRWNLYMTGTAANYLAGVLNIGSTTLSGYKLDVNGTTRLNGSTTITGSTTAASGIARGELNSATLVAAANSDNLIALDIAPTFTNGAFTGVNNIGLRLINTLNSTGDVDPKLNPLFQLSSSFWNSSLGAVRATASLQVTSYQRNTNPTISKLSFLVGTDNAAATEQMFITSAGLFGTNGGANFSGGTGSYLNDVTLIQTAAATSGGAISSNRLVLKGNAWNSVQGSRPSMGYLQMINVTNNANPTTDKLSFFVGSADNNNLNNVVGNATERIAIRTDGIFSYFNLAGTEFIRLVGSTGNILINTTTDVASSKLTINSTTQGFLPPRMTTSEKNAISSPATGLVVFDTTLGKLCVFATTWQTITSV